MASSQGQPSLASTSTPSVTTLDTLDLDQYINYDPSPILSDCYSPEPSRAKSMSTPLQPDESSSNLLLARPSQKTFAGPSHQYELHKQQTGLPVGALANTFAVNQNDHIVYGQAQRMYANSNRYFGANTIDDAFDFNTAPAQMTSTDMEIDFASPLYDTNIDYINPNAIGGQESPVNSMPTKQRAWPGMHQQQAAMAKAQAQAQAHAQQQQQQRQHAVPSQQDGAVSHHSSQQSSSSTAHAKDPIVEERISRLLNQMRHKSVASSNDDSPTPTASGSHQHLGRARKDEEDMDEDERLLASEEGKKLSSKERRQLRNKVSARAFRSRRKEYIGQLEGEIAAKTGEADELRAKNQELMTENTRLTDLTRMLLESPAFSSFLNELSGTDGQVGTSSTTSQQESPAPKIEDTAPEAPKDVNPHQSSSHLPNNEVNAPLGMALMPESYSRFNAATTTWADNMDSELYDAQVYAVTSMPEGPALDQFDIGLLSGKSSSAVGSFFGCEGKQDYPVIGYPTHSYEEGKAQLPNVEASRPTETDFDESNPAFTFYEEATPSSKSFAAQRENIIFSNVQPAKALERIKFTFLNEGIDGSEVSAATMEKFLCFCSFMEAPSRRVASITSHLR